MIKQLNQKKIRGFYIFWYQKLKNNKIKNKLRYFKIVFRLKLKN